MFFIAHAPILNAHEPRSDANATKLYANAPKIDANAPKLYAYASKTIPNLVNKKKRNERPKVASHPGLVHRPWPHRPIDIKFPHFFLISFIVDF